MQGQLMTYLAGVAHRPGARERLARLIHGEELTLIREPENPFDKNAVAVYDGDLHLGYVPAADAPAVVRALQSLPVHAIYLGAPATTTILISWSDDE
jgi:hypothetical protein